MLNILDIILDWIKQMLRDCIMGNLDGMFDQINTEVGEVAVNVGSYEIVSKIGAGGMSDVYKALFHDPQFKR